MDDTLQVKPEDILHLATLKEALGAFRHEVSQPLNAIIMAAQIVQLRLDKSLLPDTEKAFLTQRLELISAQVRKANDILQEVRDYASKGALNLGETNLKDIVERIRAMMAQQFMFRGIEVVSGEGASTHMIEKEDVPLVEGAIVQAFAFARDTVEAADALHNEKGGTYSKRISVSLADEDAGPTVTIGWNLGDSSQDPLLLEADGLPGIYAAQAALRAKGADMTLHKDRVEIVFSN